MLTQKKLEMLQWPSSGITYLFAAPVKKNAK